MKIICILFTILTSFSPAFACAFDYKITAKEFKEFPMIVYIKANKDETIFSLYFKKVGDFEGLHYAGVTSTAMIGSNKKTTELKIVELDPTKRFNIAKFRIKNKYINHSTLQLLVSEVEGDPKTGAHYCSISYDINLRDIASKYSSSKDTDLDLFLKKGYSKQRKYNL